MTTAEYSMVAFAVLNAARIFAYFPQIIRVCRDPHGARAVSLLTWTIFAAANIATVGYALVVLDDYMMALVFALNGAGCLAIVIFTAIRRLQEARLATRMRPTTFASPM